MDMMQVTDQQGQHDSDRATTMRAIVQDSYGTADVLRPGSLDVPAPGDGEVLVRVRAAGLDRGTWHLMTGLPRMARLMTGLRTPKRRVPGLDLAGTVVAVGSGVTRFSPGDEVYGIGAGSYAEYAVAKEAKLARKPATLTFEQAAVVPVSGLTALQAVRDTGRVQPGQRVLVTGASGGVGSYAVQVAKAFGAEVTGVCSTSKLDLVRALGADHVIDYTQEHFADRDEQWDVIIDINGSTSVRRLARSVSPRGTVALVGGENGGTWTGGFLGRPIRAMALSLFSRKRLAMVMAKETGVDLDELSRLIEAGQVTPAVDSVFALEDAADAMRRLEAGLVRGKVAISV
jgi:NADPH:quinone reductase-like Zn-dependent oxidoreductase